MEASLSLRCQDWHLEIAFYHKFDLGLLLYVVFKGSASQIQDLPLNYVGETI